MTKRAHQAPRIKLSNDFFLEISISFPGSFYYYKPGVLTTRITWKTIDDHIENGTGAIWREIREAANELEAMPYLRRGQKVKGDRDDK
jgi:hypothetical protein